MHFIIATKSDLTFVEGLGFKHNVNGVPALADLPLAIAKKAGDMAAAHGDRTRSPPQAGNFTILFVGPADPADERMLAHLVDGLAETPDGRTEMISEGGGDPWETLFARHRTGKWPYWVALAPGWRHAATEYMAGRARAKPEVAPDTQYQSGFVARHRDRRSWVHRDMGVQVPGYMGYAIKDTGSLDTARVFPTVEDMLSVLGRDHVFYHAVPIRTTRETGSEVPYPEAAVALLNMERTA